MKNLFFALAFMLMGTFTFANNNVKEDTNVEKQGIELILEAQENMLLTRCCNWTADMLGNRYCKEVKCPDVIIVEYE